MKLFTALLTCTIPSRTFAPVKHLPNFLTLMNLFAGCLAVVALFKGNTDLAGMFIIAALVCDFFDGFVARLVGASGDLGKQLDSLADMVSFGLVPGVVMYQLFGKALWIQTMGQPSALDYGQYFMFIVTLFACLRLAKFNIDTRQTSSFVGLPVPANTLFIMSLPFIFEHDTIGVGRYLMNPYILIGIAALSAWIQVAEIPMISLKISSKNIGDYKGQIILLLAAIVLIPVLKFGALPMIIFLYILLSLIFPPHKTSHP